MDIIFFIPRLKIGPHLGCWDWAYFWHTRANQKKLEAGAPNHEGCMASLKVHKSLSLQVKQLIRPPHPSSWKLRLIILCRNCPWKLNKNLFCLKQKSGLQNFSLDGLESSKIAHKYRQALSVGSLTHLHKRLSWQVCLGPLTAPPCSSSLKETKQTPWSDIWVTGLTSADAATSSLLILWLQYGFLVFHSVRQKACLLFGRWEEVLSGVQFWFRPQNW